MTLSTSIAASISATETSALDAGTASFPANVRYTKSLASGTAANQADVLWSDTRTLAASATENLDLAGVLIGAFGGIVVNAKIKYLIITTAAGNTNNVVVGGAASNAFPLFGDPTDTVALKPDGVLLVGAGGIGGHATVTAGTGDILKIANSGGTTPVTYTIAIVGTSA